MRILVFDNYDSFTYNLVHQLRELGFAHELSVRRNDKISLEEVADFDKILLSPGPGLPSQAGIMPELISTYAPSKSILGICLGHQGIAESFGAELYNLPEVLHGISIPTRILDPEDPLFRDMPQDFACGRYHSWAVKPQSLRGELICIADDARGEVMALRHSQYDVAGLQFHPESVLTEHGMTLISNWIHNSYNPSH